jgi:hypothetical protein
MFIFKGSAGGTKIFFIMLLIIVVIYTFVIILVIVKMTSTKQEAIDLCIKKAVKSQNITESNANIKKSCKNSVNGGIWLKSLILILSALFTVSE